MGPFQPSQDDDVGLVGRLAQNIPDWLAKPLGLPVMLAATPELAVKAGKQDWAANKAEGRARMRAGELDIQGDDRDPEWINSPYTKVESDHDAAGPGAGEQIIDRLMGTASMPIALAKGAARAAADIPAFTRDMLSGSINMDTPEGQSEAARRGFEAVGAVALGNAGSGAVAANTRHASVPGTILPQPFRAHAPDFAHGEFGPFVRDDASSFVGPKEAFNASKNATLYDPPVTPKRSISDDYSGMIPADDFGRLTHDIDGRPFNADATYVFGRRAVGGHEEAFSSPTISDVNAISERLNGQGLESVARREIGGDAGRFKKTYNLNNDAEYHAYVANDLTPSQVPKVGLHEIGHGIDTFANEIPIDGLSKELGQLYHDLNDSMGRRGKPTKPSLQTNPATMGYKGDHVPREFMAEAIRAYMQDPSYIKSVAPKTAARIRKYVNGNQKFSDVVQFNSNSSSSAFPGAVLGSGDDIEP